ncbi:DUF4397 domain-containing protein [Cellulosimicrobium marinum]|uniref:DUF4397 domain-containing protein n=1 Tax=Cellulosimicrobium marinum TaxID=1638992 RepID=UPI001E33644A|nr:DUF4397 domain-containing protein [Cellulosimicrobium marinum]MCB7135823.1 DUF4397 domain-containing protein [Cellulosimicrobium marinum]
MHRTARRSAALAGAVGLVALGAFAPASADTAENASLSVLHGVPDTPVDVWVNDELTLDDFQPGDLAGPLDLPAGSYSVAITAPDAADASEPVIGPVDLPLEAGGSYTAVAHLDAAGEPTATLFTNDTSPTAAGEGRLTVRHVAAAPAVDVLAGDEAVITGLENPDEEVLDLPAGTVPAAVAAAGTTDPVLGPADVTVAEGVNTIAYAWGSLEADNLALATQTVEGLHSSPSGVPAGMSGLAAESSVSGVATSVAIAFAASTVGLLLVAAGVMLVRAMREQHARAAGGPTTTGHRSA